MLPKYIPAYSIAPFIGLTANFVFTFLCFTVFMLNRSFRAVGYLVLFYLAVSFFFLGYAVYGFQASQEAIIFWYRIMLAGLALMPAGQFWFAKELFNQRQAAVSWLVTLLGLALALAALLGQGEWLLATPLEKFPGGADILRPRSRLLRPAIFLFGLISCGGLLAMVASRFKQQAKERQLALLLYCLGLVFWGLSGIHDALFALGWVSPLGDTVMWFGSLGLSVSLVMTVGITLAALQRSVNKARDMFERFVPGAYLDRIAREGLSSIRLGEAARQQATILYSDIRDFTRLAGRLDPSELVTFVNSYLEQMTLIVGRCKGVVDRFIGDAILCLFEGEWAQIRAVDCAVRMLAQTNGMKRPGARDERTLKIGIGIHCGPVILGTIGSSSRMDSTVMGLAVNLACRLEEATKELSLKILISEEVTSALPSNHTHLLRPVGDIWMRGSARPVAAWEVFDLDPPELAQAKQKSGVDIGRLREHISQGRADRARELLTRALALFPEDRALSFLHTTVEKWQRGELDPQGKAILDLRG